MKVLQVISSIDSRGGGPIEGLIQQGEQLIDMGFEVHTASLDPPSITVDPRLHRRTLYLLGPARLGYGFAPRLEPWLREHGGQFDCVVVHGMWQYHGYCVAKVCRALGVPYVVFLHGMLDPWFNRTYPLKKLKKWLYWPWGEYRVLRDARFVLFTTAEEMRLAPQSFWLYKARERLVGYGIAPRAIPRGEAIQDFLERFPHLRGKRLLLYLSRIHPKKGCDLLVEAFARFAAAFPDTHLVLAGPDGVGWQRDLEARVNELNLGERVTFPGMLSGRVKWGAFDAAEVFILPSHQENFGIVVAEALASAVPVLTTYSVNIWREVKQEGAGLIEPDTLEGTCELLRGWLEAPPAQREAMRLRAVDCFGTHFDIRRVAVNFAQALRDAASTDA